MIKKIIKPVIKPFIIVVLVLVIVFSICYITVTNNVNITINTDETYQTVQGFGASSAWYFKKLGAIEDNTVKEEIIEMLYGDSGMKLSSFRYNIGAGSEEIEEIINYSEPYRMAESFFISENYMDKSSFADIDNYNFTRDADVISLMEMALAKNNINKVVLFANSPHYLMTESGMTNGEYEYQNNLSEEYYSAYSDYLLIIANNIYQNIILNYGNDIKIYISPVNEPQWRWGGEYASQEGCHYDPQELAAFYDVFYTKLTDFNVTNGTSFVVDIFESGNYKLTNIRKYFDEFSKYEWFKEIDEISVHSYSVNDNKSKKTRFRNYMDRNYSDYSISMSEYCEMEWGRDTSIDSGLLTGRIILRDMGLFNANEWSWWLALSIGDYNDGLVYWDYNEETTESDISVLKRYYTMSHFSRYLSAGDIRIGLADSDKLNISGIDSIAFKKENGDIVIIMINNTNLTRNITIRGDYTSMTTVTTSTSKNLEEISSEYNNKIELEEKSITTIILAENN